MDIHEAYINLVLALDQRRANADKFNRGPGSVISKIKTDTIDECQALIRHHLGEVIDDDD